MEMGDLLIILIKKAKKPGLEALVYAWDVEKVNVDDKWRFFRNCGPSRCRCQSLLKRQVSWNVKSPEATTVHGKNAFVYTSHNASRTHSDICWEAAINSAAYDIPV